MWRPEIHAIPIDEPKAIACFADDPELWAPSSLQNRGNIGELLSDALAELGGASTRIDRAQLEATIEYVSYINGPHPMFAQPLFHEVGGRWRCEFLDSNDNAVLSFHGAKSLVVTNSGYSALMRFHAEAGGGAVPQSFADLTNATSIRFVSEDFVPRCGAAGELKLRVNQREVHLKVPMSGFADYEWEIRKAERL